MKRCEHTNWLSLCSEGNDTYLAVSDRLGIISTQIPKPDTQIPSLFVLIGNRAKTVALRELFGVKKKRRLIPKRIPGEIHLHVDASSIFNGRPLLIVDSEMPSKILRTKSTSTKCHEVIKRLVQRPNGSCRLDEISSGIYTQFLFPFVDIFCFFSDDLGGFKQVARHLAAWLEQCQTSTIPRSTRPRVVIVTEKIPPGAENEKEARKAFLWLLSEETTRDLFEQISAIDIIALFPAGSLSVDARHRLLKERIMSGSDQVRKTREDVRLLFSLAHYFALLKSAYEHFSQTAEEPYNFIKASRVDNPFPLDLDEHLMNFLKHVKSPRELIEFAAPAIASSFLLDCYPPDSHLFLPEQVFEALYKTVFPVIYKERAIAFEGCQDVVLRSGFVDMIRKHLLAHFEQLVCSSMSSAEIHRHTLSKFKDRWSQIESTSTCLCCLRRRPQYSLHCGHVICENCVLVFGEVDEDDPWVYKIHQCFLCGKKMPERVTIRTHPPTAGVGILCIDGGGARGVLPLGMMKRIQERIGLSIPFQRYFKSAFGVSSGGLIVLAMFVNGWSIDESTETFEQLAKVAFKPRKVLQIPIFRHCLELIISYFADGLYPPENIEAALKLVFGNEKSILDFSHATSSGTRIGLPVATVDGKPSRRVFTNYNGVGKREKGQDRVIRPKDGAGRIPLWEIARSASAALGFFPPKHIRDVGTFQDAGPLENDPLISALSELTAMFPTIEEPDFVISLGTGEKHHTDLSTDIAKPTQRKSVLQRLSEAVWEKMQDEQIREAIQTRVIPKWYHRLNIKFDGTEPRLDQAESIPELKQKVKDDDTLSEHVANAADCLIASLFYFELESIPERREEKFVGLGHILCSVSKNDRDFQDLMDQLAAQSAQFLLDDYPIALANDPSCFSKDGNFRKAIELNTADRFTISLKKGLSDTRDISGSPFSIGRLITAQGLNASFGRPDHRKRKASNDFDFPRKKRRCV